MKKFMGIATAAVFGLGIFTTSAKAETIVTTDVLNVRENPTTESKVVGKLLDGYKVNVLHTENGWSKVQLNSGKEAFISADYTKDTYYVTANVLNVRAGANTDSEILGKLKKDDVIETTHQVQNDWIQFEYNGKTAYVHVPYLTGKAPVKVQPVVKVEKTTTVQDTAKASETVKVQEVIKTKEAPKTSEANQATENARKVAEQKEKQPVAKETEKNTQSSSREFQVVATAYTADPLENGYKAGDQVKSALGHNLTANPNMKLIAVDPSVIPLGSKVWVEGYGVAIAGDTGGAIKGNKIDVLMPDKGTSSSWGRKTVTVKVLN
ncbi:enterotoxin [Bacillus cereus]|nr:enterotoxin [Bacillus cereus]